jgi:hypothetical protein
MVTNLTKILNWNKIVTVPYNILTGGQISDTTCEKY